MLVRMMNVRWGKLFSHCVFGIWTKYLSLGIESGIICSPELRLARDERSESIEEISTPVRLSSECPGPGHLITGHPQHLSGSPHHFFSFFFAAILNFPGPASCACAAGIISEITTMRGMQWCSLGNYKILAILSSRSHTGKCGLGSV